MKHIKQKLTRYGGVSGVFNSSPTGAPIDGAVEVMFAGLMGALAGFVLGLLAGTITRVITINATNGSRGGMGWAAWGATGGALAFAIIELLD
ncbi:MAG TPA: hypothetical protein VK530_16150 [Candidatus Acidoferrum sp.]|nr:hypothetical protein [Candidatus Acidoferrum sp.]